MSAIKNISLFVPHVFPNFTQKYVVESFAELGDVDRVDFVMKQDRDGKQFNAAYIHFNRWYDNRDASMIQANISNEGSAKFYHDDSEYYWLVLPNTAKKYVSGERKPRIDLGESKSLSVKAVEKTPEKTVKKLACPGAPKKLSYVEVADKPTKSVAEFEDEFQEWYANLESHVDIPNEASEETDQMAELEAELEAEDENLISIDWRYVQTLEQENMWLRTEITQLRMAVINLHQICQAEKAKVTAFSNV